MLTARQLSMFHFGMDDLPSSERNSFAKLFSGSVALWILILDSRVFKHRRTSFICGLRMSRAETCEDNSSTSRLLAKKVSSFPLLWSLVSWS
jgi:hypothetical protein